MTTHRTRRPAVHADRRARLLRLFRPSAPLVGLLDGDRDEQRLRSDLRAARSRQLPDA